MALRLSQCGRWPRRLAAVAFGFGVLVLVEVVLRAAGVAEADPAVDPFVGFSRVAPLFALDPVGDRFVISPSRSPFFRADGFAREKGEGTFRIFCLGGSTVQGRPYSIETAFPRWLEIELETAEPDRGWEVVNCGGVSYASYRLIPLMQECLAHEPDLIVVCTGHNEFLEERTYGHIKPLAERWAGAYEIASRWRLYRVAQRLAGPPARSPRPILKEEVDALLDYRGGLEAYSRDPGRRRGVIAHFADNIRRMAALAKAADVPVLFLSPPVNLKGCPPFKSVHRAGMTGEELARFDRLVAKAESHYATDPARAIALLQLAVEIDPEFALSHFSLGQLYLARADPRRAREAFERALEEDICPLRMLGEMRRQMEKICSDAGVPYADLQSWAEGGAGFGIPGDDVLVDHIHPAVQGHQQIATLIADQVIGAHRTGGWPRRIAAAREAQMASLDELYFVHGNERLRGLRAWTEGRASGPPLSEHQSLPPES